MNATLLALLLLLFPGDPAIRISYLSARHVYVDGGSSAGLREGEILRVQRDGKTIAELEVVFVAERSATCKVRSEQVKVKVGDRIQRQAAAAMPAPAAAPEPVAPPTPSPSRPPAAAPRPPARARKSSTRATGSLGLGWSASFDGKTPARDWSDWTARANLTVHDIGGAPLTARLRGRLRRVQRPEGRGRLLGRSHSQDRIYEASLEYAPADGNLRAAAGRIYPYTAIGSLDGLLAEVRVLGPVGVGAFAGRTAEPGGRKPGSKLGGFVRAAPTARSALHEAIFAYIREHRNGSIDREYLSMGARVGRGAARFDGRAELDRASGARRDLAEASAILSTLTLHLSYRVSGSTTLSVGYDRRQDPPDREDLELPTERFARFEREARQGFNARIDFAGQGGFGGGVGGSMRLREGDSSAWSVFASLRPPQVLGLAASLDATLHSSGMLRGTLLGGHLSREIGPLRLDLSGGFSAASTREEDDSRSNQWLRINGWIPIARSVSLSGGLERQFGDDSQATRASVELSTHF